MDEAAVGGLLKSIAGAANPGLAETIRRITEGIIPHSVAGINSGLVPEGLNQMTSGLVSENLRNTIAAAEWQGRAATAFSEKILSAYKLPGSAFVDFAEVIGDAQLEHDRVLQQLAALGTFSQQATAGIPSISPRLMDSIAQITEPSTSILNAHRRIIEGTTTPFGAATAESMRSLIDISGMAQTVAESSAAFERVAKLARQIEYVDFDDALDEGLEDEIEEALDDPGVSAYLSNGRDVVSTYLSELSAATRMRTSELLANDEIRMLISSMITAALYWVIAENYPGANNDASAGAILLVSVLFVALKPRSPEAGLELEED